MKKAPSLEDVQKSWNMFESLCNMIKDENINTMIGALENRLVMCPFSHKSDEAGCYPGGLIENAISVTHTMNKLNKLYKFNFSKSSILKVGLFHELGKIGDLENSLFIDQDSDWHRSKLGQNYKFNENIQKMSTSHRTLFLLQYFNVRLEEDEWIAIQIAQGNHFEENRFYVNSEPDIGMLIQHARAAINYKK